MNPPYVAHDAFLADTIWQLFLLDTCIVAAQAQHSIETAAPCRFSHRFWSSHDFSTKKCRYGKWSGIPEHSLINHHELISCQPKPDRNGKFTKTVDIWLMHRCHFLTYRRCALRMLHVVLRSRLNPMTTILRVLTRKLSGNPSKTVAKKVPSIHRTAYIVT